jgi:hypothetical protein
VIVEITDLRVRQERSGVLARSVISGRYTDRLVPFLVRVRGANDLLVQCLIESSFDTLYVSKDILPLLHVFDRYRPGVSAQAEEGNDYGSRHARLWYDPSHITPPCSRLSSSGKASIPKRFFEPSYHVAEPESLFRQWPSLLNPIKQTLLRSSLSVVSVPVTLLSVQIQPPMIF